MPERNSCRWGLRGLGVLLLGAFGALLYGSPHLPDVQFTWMSVFGSFLIFLFWAFGTVGWGRFWARVLDWPATHDASVWAGALALGSVWASASVYLINLVAPMGPHLRGVAWLWVLAGAMLGASKTPLKPKENFRFESPLAKITATVILLAVSARMIEGFQIRAHGDAYICYLTGPRAWFDAGTLRGLLGNYSYFYAASWEALFQWGNLLLAGAPGTGLDAVQRFGQWCSAFFGQAGLLLCIYALLIGNNSRRGQLIALLAALAAGSVPVLRNYANHAKNDIGASFWLISALLPLFSTQAPSRVFTGGLLLGVGAMAKLSYGSFVVGQVLAWCVWGLTCRPRFKDLQRLARAVLILGLGGLAGASWILIRNLVLTGNPVFPFLGGLFPAGNLIGLEMQYQLGNVIAEKEISFATLQQYLMEFLRSWWPIPCSLVALLVPASVLKEERNRWIIFGAWVAALLFTVAFRPATELRYQGPTLVLLGGAGIWILGRALMLIPKPRIGAAAFSLLFLGLLATSGVSFFTFLQLNERKYEPTPVAIRKHSGGEAKKWLRDHVRPEERAISLGDNEIYYAMHTGMIEYYYDAGLSAAVHGHSDPRKIIEMFLGDGRRYLDFYRPFFGRTPGPMLALVDFVEPLKKCIVFEDATGWISDLKCIRSSELFKIPQLSR